MLESRRNLFNGPQRRLCCSRLYIFMYCCGPYECVYGRSDWAQWLNKADESPRRESGETHLLLLLIEINTMPRYNDIRPLVSFSLPLSFSFSLFLCSVQLTTRTLLFRSSSPNNQTGTMRSYSLENTSVWHRAEGSREKEENVREPSLRIRRQRVRWSFPVSYGETDPVYKIWSTQIVSIRSASTRSQKIWSRALEHNERNKRAADRTFILGNEIKIKQIQILRFDRSDGLWIGLNRLIWLSFERIVRETKSQTSNWIHQIFQDTLFAYGIEHHRTWIIKSG